MHATVVVATRGAAPLLGDTLRGLARQTFRDFDVLVVDNNDRPVVADRLLSAADIKLSIHHEPRAGLSAARNAGLRQAQAPYVAFLDDDAEPQDEWLRCLIDGVARFGASAAGGPVMLDLPERVPRWISDCHRRLLSELDWGADDIPSLDRNFYLVGANFIVSVDAALAVGGFDEGFGRIRERLRSSEELDLCCRVQDAGGRVSYLAEAKVVHHIPVDRLRSGYLLRRAFWQGRSDAMLEARHGRPTSFGDCGPLKSTWSIGKALLATAKGPTSIRRMAALTTLARESGFCIQCATSGFPRMQDENSSDRRT